MVSSNSASNTKRVAFLVEKNFEDSEFKIPYEALKNAGANVTVVGSRMNDEYHGKKGNVSIQPDATATEVRSEDFDAIVIPGGGAPDKVRANPNAVRLVMDAIAQNKIIAAVCHGPQVLIEADALRGKYATGYRAIRKDLQNAGANFVDEPLVVDGNIITARRPGDMAIFTTALLTRLGLTIEGLDFPEESNRTFEWWKLAESWGGSDRNDIVNTIRIANSGEHYTYKVFEEYINRVSDPEIRTVLAEVRSEKERNIHLLESRLQAFGEEATLETAGSEALAALQSWLQSSDDLEVLRRALGDVQTGVVDSYSLCAKLTDPLTTEIFEQIESNLARCEQRLGDLYRARAGDRVAAPEPTTVAAS